ncbi:MAG: YbjQ family protein [Arenicella sp.]
MIDLIILMILLCVGYLVGTYREKTHYKSILKREKKLKNILLFDTKTVPAELHATTEIIGGELVQGHVVVSVDYFKRFVAGLRKLFGGRLRSYESLLDRARREAVLRMKTQARRQGSNMIFNVKFETASISKGAGNRIGSVEVYVYGSAVRAKV